MLITLFLLLISCSPFPPLRIPEEEETETIGGGGRDAITINMPFAAGESYRCSQGTGGAYSHRGTATRYDVDFDTPNDTDELVYAPVSGVAYVHDNNAETNFGLHVNIDTGDGTYIILAHLGDIFVEDESEVAAGQIIGIEGTTGNSTGDHLHIGRHWGDAAEDGIRGSSQEGLEFSMSNATLGTSVQAVPVTSMICGLTSGHVYTSVLGTGHWHPNGTLVKTPFESAVYLLEEGRTRVFVNERAFISRNYDFADVALVSPEELSCFSAGEGIEDESAVRVVYDDAGGTGVWLVRGTESDANRTRQKVASVGWQGVVKSWGMSAATYDDLLQASDLTESLGSYPVESGNARYRDGSLISPADASDVYLMSDGMAMPIETWNAYLLMGFWDRRVLEVERSEFESIVTTRGSCATGISCITESIIAQCGGAEVGGGSYEAAGEPEEDEEDTEIVTPPDDDETEEYDEGTDDGTTEEDEDDDEEDTVEIGDLVLTWSTPSAREADRITLSGEFTSALGAPGGWIGNLAEETDASGISYHVPMEPGDALRFSVEYVIGGATSWSCLAPFPPGTLQGTPTATWNGVSQDVVAVGDPTSSGCGLQVVIEE